MPQKITRGFKQMLAEAERLITTLEAPAAVALHGSDDVVFIDLRDPREIDREGTIPGAFHCPRGMLEFWIDPESPYHKSLFSQDKQFVFFCAGGWRSALAAATAATMGMEPVAHIAGGLAAWREAGGPVNKSEPREDRQDVK